MRWIITSMALAIAWTGGMLSAVFLWQHDIRPDPQSTSIRLWEIRAIRKGVWSFVVSSPDCR